MAKFSQEFLRQMATPAMGQGLFTAAKQAAQLPGQLRQQQQMQQQRRQLAQIDTNSPEGLLRLAQFYRQQGDVPNAVKYEEAARKLQAQITAETAFGSRKTSLATAATALGLPELASRVEGVVDKEELKEIAKEIRQAELDKMPTQSPLVRKRMANAAGISPDLFDELELATVRDSVFNEYISGEKGDLKPFQRDNKVEFFRVNERGRVWSDETQKWVEASELGLEQAPPQIQRVENIASGMADELAKVGAKNFSEAHENARLAADALGSVNRTLPTIDNMFTGAGAELKLNISRFTRAFGVDVVDPSSNADTEAYVAESGRRVAQYITNLGAGTGLSDADREYAKKVVAGDITVDRIALGRLLNVIKDSAQRTIKNYQDTRNTLEEKLGENAPALAFYGNIYVDPGPTASGLSSQAQSYLPKTP